MLQSIIEGRATAIAVDTYNWSLTELCELYRQDKLIFPEKDDTLNPDVELAALLESLILGIPGTPLFAYVNPNETWEFFDVRHSRKLHGLIRFILEPRRIVFYTLGFSHWEDVQYKGIPHRQRFKLKLNKFPITLISGDRQLATSYINSRI